MTPMPTLRVLAATLLVTAMCYTGLASRAKADETDKKTVVTFSEPVEIPGKVLAAGTYVLKLLDSENDRDIVLVFDKDEKQLISTIVGISDYRANTPGKTLIQFEERASGSPEAIKAWFYPGDNYGVQFVYPHDRAVAIAKRTKQNVLSMRNEMAEHMAKPAPSPDSPSVQAMKKTEVTGVSPSGDPVDPVTLVASKPNK
jgi:hypothetical protein